MREHDPQVLSYSHLRDFPREKEALHTIKKIASLVKPLMRARGWRVGELAEFFPEQKNLLGLNVNRGQKIFLRLRYPGDRTQFLPVEEITDTMLHELAHNVHGPHDAKFHAVWDQLRDEHDSLVKKGYTGEGFLSDGRRLGGSRQVPVHEACRLGRAAAEKRRAQYAQSAGSGRRLGGLGPWPGEDIRNVIIGAIERRNYMNRTLKERGGCGNDGTKYNAGDIERISEQAARNGFRTQAEEDAANEAAIAQALWELVQEEEKAKHGKEYLTPSPQKREGNSILCGGGSSGIRDGIFMDSSGQNEPASKPVAATFPQHQLSTKAPSTTMNLNIFPLNPSPPRGWICTICTLHNQVEHLCCDACGTERPEDMTGRLTSSTPPYSERPRPPATNMVGQTLLTNSRPSKSTRRLAGAATVPGSYKILSSTSGRTFCADNNGQPATWQCSFCGQHMERLWWTCSTCGKMKDRS